MRLREETVDQTVLESLALIVDEADQPRGVVTAADPVGVLGGPAGLREGLEGRVELVLTDLVDGLCHGRRLLLS